MPHTIHIEITISGYLVGAIWWPVGAECWKDLSYNATDAQARTDGKMTLRDHVLRATMDGDFQGCAIAQGELTLTTYRDNGRARTRRSKSYPLDQFPSIADCLHSDPDWFPDFGDDDE